MAIKIKAVERNVSFQKGVVKYAYVLSTDLYSKLSDSKVIFAPNADIKKELKNTSISITCYDCNGNVVKRVTSSDDAPIEDPDNGNGGGNGGSNGGGDGSDPAGVKKMRVHRSKILYLHGFGSSAASSTVKTLQELLPEYDVVAPDIPVTLAEALPFLHGLWRWCSPILR